MLSGFWYDLLKSLAVSFIIYLLSRTWASVSKRPAAPTSKKLSPKQLKNQFYVSLLVFSLSLHVILSVTWEFSFSLPVILKAFSIIAALCSFVLIQGVFDSLLFYLPDDKAANDPKNIKKKFSERPADDRSDQIDD